jgi:hypothetical protein
MDRNKILSKALQKNQSKIEKETEWTRTHPNLPEESDSDTSSSDSDEEDHKMSGKKLLIKIYGGCGSCGSTKRVKKELTPSDSVERTESLIPADKAPKSNHIWKFSNPKKASSITKRLFGKDKVLYLSSNPKKKYQIQNSKGEWIRFGQMGYQDFLKHQDLNRRELYLQRALNIKGDWKKDSYSPNNLAIKILWDGFSR